MELDEWLGLFLIAVIALILVSDSLDARERRSEAEAATRSPVTLSERLERSGLAEELTGSAADGPREMPAWYPYVERAVRRRAGLRSDLPPQPSSSPVARRGG